MQVYTSPRFAMRYCGSLIRSYPWLVLIRSRDAFPDLIMVGLALDLPVDGTILITNLEKKLRAVFSCFRRLP